MATPITPSTNVCLLKCPLEMDNNHQINFASKTAQYNYFHSLPKIEFDNFSYQRQDGVIRVDRHIDDLIEYNYVMYQNENYTNKWFYAFITGMEYVNDRCTYISIQTDSWQTFQFDLNFRKCFVEREHVNNDTFGLHTLEENIPAGEWVVNSFGNIGLNTESQRNCYVMVALSELPDGSNLKSQYGNRSRIYNSIPSGCYVIGIDISDNVTAYTNLNEFISYFDVIGKADAIVAMWLVPKSYFTDPTSYASLTIYDDVGSHEYSYDCIIPKSFIGVTEVSNTQVTRNTTIDGYVPKNAKCFTKQFNYLLVTNNLGQNSTYYWEDFTGTPEFKYLSAHLTQTSPSRLVPNNYKKTTSSGGYNYSLQGSPFPIVSWSSDYYLNWQAQNGWAGASQRAQQFNREAEKHSGDVASFWGNVSEQFAYGLSQTAGAIINTINGSMASAERKPDSVHGNMNGDFTYSVSKCNFTYYKMSMRAEVAKVVDDYFSAYGYKVSSYKVPNITGRRNWNYVKCIDVNVTGNIPQENLEEIKSFFNKGITIWHNTSTFLDYSQNNDIV